MARRPLPNRHIGRTRVLFPSAALIVAGIAACGADVGQVHLCERVLAAVVDSPGSLEILNRREDQDEINSVTLDYAMTPGDGTVRRGSITCRFGGDRFSDDRLTLVGVRTDALGDFSEAALMLLRKRLKLD